MRCLKSDIEVYTFQISLLYFISFTVHNTPLKWAFQVLFSHFANEVTKAEQDFIVSHKSHC